MEQWKARWIVTQQILHQLKEAADGSLKTLTVQVVKYKIKFSVAKLSAHEKNNFNCMYTLRASKLPNNPQDKKDFILIVKALGKCQLSA